MEKHNWSVNHGYINQGYHQGDVSFQMRKAPPPYHQNAIRCNQCNNFTWRNTPDCVYCGNDIKRYLQCKSIEWQINCVNYRIERLDLWIIGTVAVILLSVVINMLWLMVAGFVIAAIQCELIKQLECKRKEFKKKLCEMKS